MSWQGKDFSNRLFEAEHFNACDMTGACFRGATFRDCVFKDCQMTGVVLEGARFEHCVLEAQRVDSPEAAGVRFIDCRMDKASLRLNASTGRFVPGEKASVYTPIYTLRCASSERGG